MLGMLSNNWARFLARAQQRQDAAALAAYRILFGGLMFFGTLRFMSMGWLERLYAEPTFHFKYWGFSWVTVPDLAGLYLLYSGIALCALLVALGAFYRIAIIGFWCLFSYAELMDVTYYLNHYYFVSLLTLILCFLSPHRLWSVDAWLRPKIKRVSLPVWQTWWLRFQVGLLYFYAGWAKFETDWLLHAQPLNIWLPPHAGLPLIGPFLDEVWVHYAFSWFAFAFDVSIIGFMLWKRARPFAFAVVLLFHALTHIFFNIGLFPFIMVLSVLIFFDPNWPRRVLDAGRQLWRRFAKAGTGQNEPLLSLRHKNGLSAAESNSAAIGLRTQLAALAIVLFCTVQFLLPLRQWLYPGTVLWHEQGMRFSWRVMLREKSGALSYRVVQADGNTKVISPHSYLNEIQYREMAGQPDLILQLAHRIRDDFNAQGAGPVAVYADSWVSLNGRPAARLIKPNVNLSEVQDGLAVADWITAPPDNAPTLQPPLRLSKASLTQTEPSSR